MLSEQDFMRWWATSPKLHAVDIYAFIKPHLRGEFDREAIAIAASCLHSGTSLVEVADKIERLHNGESDPNPNNYTVTCEHGVLYRCSDCRALLGQPCGTCRGSKKVHHCFGHQRPGTVENCSICNMGDSEPCPDCQCKICGGSRVKCQVYECPDECRSEYKTMGACSKCPHNKPCPDCKPVEVRYHRNGGGMHLDERSGDEVLLPQVVYPGSDREYKCFAMGVGLTIYHDRRGKVRRK